MSRVGAVYLALVIGIVLAGCASPAPELAAPTAETFQASVIEVADLAADGDVTGALARLDELQGQLDDAEAADEVSATRATVIQQAIDLVRVDLEALVPEPSPTPSPSESEEKPGNGNNKPGKPEKPGKPGKP